MDEYKEAKSWTVLFLAGLRGSLWVDFFYSFLLMPKVLFYILRGEQEELVSYVVDRISLRAFDASPPPQEFREQASAHPRESMFLIGWLSTNNLWFCPRIRIDITAKLAPIMERKWRFKGWID